MVMGVAACRTGGPGNTAGGTAGSSLGSASAASAELGVDVDRLAGVVRLPTPVVQLEAVRDIDGAPLSFTAAEGNLLLVYFGYLSCPDVCPTTLSDLRVALDELGNGAAAVEVAMVTVDPGRDDEGGLRSYLDHFLVGARGVRLTDDASLRRVADAFGATYELSTGADGAPQVSHSAFLYVLDDHGRLIEQWPFGTPPKDMTADLRLLETSTT